MKPEERARWKRHKHIVCRIDNISDLTCRKCLEVKPQSQFKELKYYVPMRRGILVRMFYPHCHDCRTSASSQWRGNPLYNAQVDEFLRWLSSRARSAATKRGIAYLLTGDDVIEMFLQQEGKCSLSGTKMMTEAGTTGARNWSAASVDRVDSHGNYEPGNVQLVCAGVNLMKGEMPQAMFVEFCRKVVEHQVAKMDELERQIAG